MQDLDEFYRPYKTELKSRESYILDLRYTSLKESHFGTLLLPVCRGKYGRDFDVIEDALPPEVQAKLQEMKRSQIEDHQKAYHVKYSPARVAKFMATPFGFLCKDMPAGAFIVRDTGR